MSPTEHRQRMVAAATAETKRRERLTKKLEQLDLDVIESAHRCFNSDKAAAEWLIRPLASADGRTPVLMVGTLAGRRKVLRLLGAIEHGVFA